MWIVIYPVDSVTRPLNNQGQIVWWSDRERPVNEWDLRQMERTLGKFSEIFCKWKTPLVSRQGKQDQTERLSKSPVQEFLVSPLESRPFATYVVRARPRDFVAWVNEKRNKVDLWRPDLSTSKHWKSGEWCKKIWRFIDRQTRPSKHRF